VHNAVGGTMSSASSPKDPIFFLHHANIDRLWAEWQTTHGTAQPGNLPEALQPTPLFGNKVSSVQSILTLGYQYV
jgi:tyrosinase